VELLEHQTFRGRRSIESLTKFMANAQTIDIENHGSSNADPISPMEAKDAQVYSAFSVGQRYIILAIVATAGFLSTLSANIYFPALGIVQNV
jgi:hypothetical protein